MKQGAFMADIISICCGCGSIRNDAGAWDGTSDFRRVFPSNRLSHGICPACLRRLYPDMAELMAKRATAARGKDAPASPPKAAALPAASWVQSA
jgi:hypothetical protein